MATASPTLPWAQGMTGGPNEIWSFGEQAYPILRHYILLRERLRPYLHAVARNTSKSGMPIMRPLLLDFSRDEKCWDVDDQFMFGPDLLVAPVTEPDATKRSVYLPAGAEWIDASTGAHLPGGSVVTARSSIGTDPSSSRRGTA